MKDIILTGIAYICAGGVLIFGSLFCVSAVALQKQDSEGK